MKCMICRRKVPTIFLDVYTCKCNNIYCPVHRNDHSCTYNYYKEHQKKLKKENPIIIKEKMIKI